MPEAGFACDGMLKEAAMALMERVATLMRANVNDLIDRAENPEKMLKQLVLDMENQLVQVKTQMAAGMAHAHVLRKKLEEHEAAGRSWHERADVAVTAGKDDMARAALKRALEEEAKAADVKRSFEEGTEESELMRKTYSLLQSRLGSTQHRLGMVQSAIRRAEIAGKAMSMKEAVNAMELQTRGGKALEALKVRVALQDGQNAAARQMVEGEPLEGEWLEEKMDELVQNDRVEKLLAELKRARMLEAG